MKRLILSLVFALSGLVYGQSNWLDSLNTYIEKEIVDYHVPGLAIGIIRGDTAIFEKYYGESNILTHSKVNHETLFPIASCTKTFTASCIGILVDEGKLHCDDKVVHYLPNFKLSDPYITNELTISDILSHRSGLAQFEGDILWYGTNYTSKEIVDKMRYYPIKGKFRTDFAYQNVMYIVAGRIIEKVTGKTWQEFLNEKIVKPLSMERTSSLISKMPIRNFTQLYIGNQQVPLNYYENAGPCGSIYSNIQCMLNWLRLWIGKGEYNGKILFSNGIYKAMTSAKMITYNPEESYGFGWYLSEIMGEKVIFHNGFLPGCRATVFIIPEKKVGLVILTNTINFLNDEIVNLVSENVLNPNNTNWEQARKESSFSFLKGCQYCWDKEREEVIRLHSNLPADYSKLKGMYKDKIYGSAIVHDKDGLPFLEFLPTKELFSGSMYYLKENQFAIIFNDKFLKPGIVNFVTDSSSQQIEGFKLDMFTSDLNFKDLYFKKTK